MADLNFNVGQSVKIDGKGLATVIKKIIREFGTLYVVKIDGVDYEAEIQAHRLSPVTGTDLGHDQQTTQPEINETREIQNIPPTELSTYLARFFISVRKSNGTEYEPSSLRTLMSSFDRQLRRHNYGEFISTGPSFAHVREVLKSKQTLLKRERKGNLPNRADPISDDEIDILWNNQQFGTTTPDSILQTLWFFNTVHFGIRGRTEHHGMCWGDVELKSHTNGHEYLEFCERQSKTRTGSDPRDVRRVTPKLWENTSNPDRCPVNVYKFYAKKRPVGYSLPHHPFYIASNTKPLTMTLNDFHGRASLNMPVRSTHFGISFT